MPPKKTPSAPKAGSAPKKAPASSAPKTKARPKSTAAASPAQDSPVKIPSLNLSYEKPKASAEVARRVPELVLKSRRGWTGPPLPFDTDEAAIAWGMKELNLGKKRAAYAKSRRTIRELRGEIKAAANNEQDSMVESAKRSFREWRPRDEKSKFISKAGMRVHVPGLTSSDETAFTMSESGSDGRHARRMGALV